MSGTHPRKENGRERERHSAVVLRATGIAMYCGAIIVSLYRLCNLSASRFREGATSRTAG